MGSKSFLFVGAIDVGETVIDGTSVGDTDDVGQKKMLVVL